MPARGTGDFYDDRKQNNRGRSFLSQGETPYSLPFSIPTYILPKTLHVSFHLLFVIRLIESVSARKVQVRK